MEYNGKSLDRHKINTKSNSELKHVLDFLIHLIIEFSTAYPRMWQNEGQQLNC